MFDNIQIEKIPELLQFKPGEPLLFNTGLFLFLFFGLLIFYNLLRKKKAARIFLLIIFSLYFYYKAAGMYFFILIASAVVNFYAGKWIASAENFTKKKIFLALALILNLTLLGYFKYTNFFIEVINDLHSSQISPLAIFLPIGISFYTFKALTYIFDIYYDTLKPVNNFFDFGLYLFFFPNVLMGPIDRASDFLPQINKEPVITKEDLGRATFLICSGLLKTVIFSNYLEENFIGRIFEFPLRYTGVENLLAIYAYALRLYCDFSGYTDMAIGISLFLGFKIMDNFNSPFKATSVADFWRRWHISLSKWLLDYLFRLIQISLRGLRIFGNVIALVVTFFVCGLWHGAGWNFILWGLYFGVLMSIALFLQKPKAKLYNALRINNTKFLKFSQIIITFHFVAFSFLIFRANNLQTVSEMIDQIINFFHGEVLMQFVEKLPLIFGLIVVGFVFHFIPAKIETGVKKMITSMPLVGKAALIAIVIWIVAQFKSADLQPFIYFQF